MKPPKNTKLIKATYVKDYIYRFEFSNGKVFDTDFKPMLCGSLSKFLDISKFKKMKIRDELGDIYWGKDWDVCFHMESYYGKDKVIPRPRKYYTDYLKKIGKAHLIKEDKRIVVGGKSKKVRAKKTKDGGRYIIFGSLPQDQQQAWLKQEGCFSCPVYKEEPKDAICLHYHDYEKFYNAWIDGRIAVHLD